MKRRPLSLALLLAIPLSLLLLASSLTWLVLSEAGLQTTANLLGRASGNRLQLEQVSGRLWDHLRIARLRWQDAGTEVDIDGIALHWSPTALLHGTLDIHALGLGDIAVKTQSDDTPVTLPDSLALPLAVRIAALETRALTINGNLLAEHLGAALDSRGGTHVLNALEARRGALQLKAAGSLAAHAPFALHLDATLDGVMNDKPFTLALQGQGELGRNEWKLNQTQGPFTLTAQAALQPFSPQPVERFSAQADKLDLAGLLPDFPHTQIDVRCSLDDTQSGGCRIVNKLAGPLDQQRLPVKEVAAQLRRKDHALDINDLRISIGQGQLLGKAALTGDGIKASLDAQQLNLADIHGSAHPTRLVGLIVLLADKQRETLKLDLKDGALAVNAELAHQGSVVTLQTLTLSAQAAQLKASGKLNTVNQEFALTGSLERFDPARFVRTASGSINGDFKANGRFSKAPTLTLDFALRDSRYAEAPASGTGHIDLSWPHLRRTDVSLLLGKNSLRLAGALGKTGEALTLDIDAPVLAPYGLHGDMQAHLVASGNLNAPLLNGRVRSNALRLPGYGRLQQLSLDTNMGAAIDAPFELRLQLERLDLNSQSNALRKLDLNLQGSRRQHQLQLAAFIDTHRPLQLALRGGFQGKHADEWQGALTRFTLENPEAQRSMQLKGDAPLVFAPEHWSVGPLNIGTQRAAFTFNATAAKGKTTAHLTAANPQIGQVLIDLAASTPDIWAPSGQSPWQGRLQADISDLGWVNPLLGEVWQIGGKLKADVQLGGTPQYPLFNGRMDADELAVRHLDRGMNLRNGSLHANIRDSILRLNEFGIDSILTSPPQTLQRLVDDRAHVNSLTAKPGRISATGQMKLGTLGLGSDASEQLHLDITLDRLGVSQTPKQWLLLSGQSRLSWQQGKLGIGARLDVDAAHWQLAGLSRPQLSSDVVVLGTGEEDKTGITPWNGDIAIGMGRYFSFEGAGARGRLAGRVQITASATDLPRASGSVNLVNGRYEAYGQQLAIERGILNFQGLLENPGLNILAMRRGTQVEAGVEITGYAQSPKIRLVSEPSVPDTEKLSWLVLGRAPDQDGSDASVLMGAVGAIFGNDMNSAGQQVRQSFGIDEFSVHSGTLGQSQNMNSRIAPLSNSSQNSGQVLSVGRQLTKQLRLSYEQALGTTGNLVKLTFKLTNRISVVGTSGSDAALDVFYGFAFGGKPPPPRQKP